MVDDSGGPGQGPVQVMVGLIGRAEEWAAFSDRWAECLGETPTVTAFKMRDAAKFQGEFNGFTRAQRDEKIRKLGTIINDFAFQVIHVTLDMSGFEEAFRHFTGGRPLTKPYFYAFHIMILAVCYDLLESGERERFEIVFDEHLSLGPKVKRWYPLVRSYMEPDAQAILPVDPTFKNDSAFVPLQAADMMAWFCRRDQSFEPHSFGWLASVFSKVEVSEHSQFLDLKRMQGWIDMARNLEDRLSVEEVLAGRKLLGL